MKNHKENNAALLQILSEYLERYPTIRFNQKALYNLNIVESPKPDSLGVVVDNYYDEPETVLKRIPKGG